MTAHPLLCATFGAMLAMSGGAASPEKILAPSPDGKFALRIVHDAGGQSAEPRNDPQHIRHAQLVSLPAKTSVAEIATIPADEARFGAPALLWSADSQWCIFTGLGLGLRDTNILVFRLAGGKFTEVPIDGLTAAAPPPKGNAGDLRAEFVKPIRWLQPGTLLLRQESHFRVTRDDENGSVYLEVTTAFSEKAGAFQVVSSKKVGGAEDLARVADAKLNAAYKQLQGKLSASGKATLKQEQVAWLAQRDAITDADKQAAFVAARAAELRQRAEAIR